MSNVKIEELGKHTARKDFDCEVEALNHYLKTMALQQHHRDIAKTDVLTFKDDSGPIIAYATQNVCEVDLSEERQTPMLKKLPINAPAIRLCRLAVDKEHKGKGLGLYMLGFTLSKALEVSQNVGCSGIVVDAKDESAQTFYETFGFITFTSTPRRLFLPMATITALIEK